MTLEHPLSRRQALAAGAAGIGIIVLAGCSSDSGRTLTAAPAGPDAPSASPPAASTGSGGVALAKVADIPVGGSVGRTSADGKPIVLAQPVAGTVVAFSAICTHRGCTVAAAGKEFHCPCHGSVFDAVTGNVKGGPAPEPLNKIDVHVAAGEVVAGA